MGCRMSGANHGVLEVRDRRESNYRAAGADNERAILYQQGAGCRASHV